MTRVACSNCFIRLLGNKRNRPSSGVKTDMSKRKTMTFDDVREIVLTMPDVEETMAYGMPAFKAGKTRFVGKPVRRRDIEPNSIGVLVTFEERDKLLGARPDIYYLTDHHAKHPTVLVRLASIRYQELRELLNFAWRCAMERSSAAKS